MNTSAKTRKVVLSCAVLTGVAMLFSNTAFAKAGKGVTFSKISHNSTLGIDYVGCSTGCDPYVGDTLCTDLLPILCIKVDGSTRPNYVVPAVPSTAAMPKQYYSGWARGHIATTVPVSGNALGSAAGADALCKALIGDGYRMAEIHDGIYTPGMDYNVKYGDSYYWHSSSPWASPLYRGGWRFYAYGNVRTDTRFWAWVNGQPSNCWNP